MGAPRAADLAPSRERPGEVIAVKPAADDADDVRVALSLANRLEPLHERRVQLPAEDAEHQRGELIAPPRLPLGHLDPRVEGVGDGGSGPPRNDPPRRRPQPPGLRDVKRPGVKGGRCAPHRHARHRANGDAPHDVLVALAANLGAHPPRDQRSSRVGLVTVHPHLVREPPALLHENAPVLPRAQGGHRRARAAPVVKVEQRAAHLGNLLGVIAPGGEGRGESREINLSQSAIRDVSAPPLVLRHLHPLAQSLAEPPVEERPGRHGHHLRPLRRLGFVRLPHLGPVELRV